MSKDKNSILGRLFVTFTAQNSLVYEKKKDTSDLYLEVHPDYRRKGFGTYLLNLATEFSVNNNKTKFESEYSLAAAGKFVKKYGFEVASDRSISRLYLKDVNWGKMKDSGSK